MIEKLEQRAIHMNFKKAVIIFLITGFALMIAVPTVLYGNFQSRIANWDQVRETDREHRERERDFREDDESDFGDGEQERDFREKDAKEREEKDLEDIYGMLHFSWGDLALLAGCVVTGMALGVWYWFLVMIWAYRKAYRMGVNGRLAVLAALFFNLAAVAVLYFYAIWKGTCANCGRVKDGNVKFCDRCGNPLKEECPQCKQEVDASSVYCSNCGRKLNESKEKCE